MIDPLKHRLGYQLRRTSAAMMADLASTLEPFGLRPTEASVLLAIAANPAASQVDIGRLLGIKRANMAPMVATLSARGLIARTALDGRSQGLSVAPSATALIQDIETAIDAHEERFTGGLGFATLSRLIEDVQRLRKPLERTEPRT